MPRSKASKDKAAGKALAKKAPHGMKRTVEELRTILSTQETDPLAFLASIISGTLMTQTIVIGDKVKEVHLRPTIEQRIAAAKACVNKLYPDLRAQELSVHQQTDIRQLSREELMIIAAQPASSAQQALDDNPHIARIAGARAQELAPEDPSGPDEAEEEVEEPEDKKRGKKPLPNPVDTVNEVLGARRRQWEEPKAPEAPGEPLVDEGSTTADTARD